MKAILFFTKCLVEKAISNARQSLPIILSATQKKMLLIGVLLSHIFLPAFAQESTVLLSNYDACHVRPMQQTQTRLGIEALTIGAPLVRVAYLIPSNRTAQPDGVANLQYAIKTGQQYYKEQMEQNGFGPKTYLFETEADGVTPFIHVVPINATDESLHGDIWGRTIQAAGNAGISVWAPGEVWVLIPEAHVMLPDGTVTGGSALGASFGTGNSPGVAMIGSNALPLFHPAMMTNDTPYDGKVLPALGAYPMKQDRTFAWFEGPTFSSVASSWLGALLHEMAHAFGLAHDFRNDNNFHGNLMGNGLRGMRGSLFPERYPHDHTRLEYTSALILNVSHYFNRNKRVTWSPVISYGNPGSVTPKHGHVPIAFQASDSDSLSLAHLRYDGNTVAEMVLDGTEADTAFAVPYFSPDASNPYTIAVHDKQGNVTFSNIQFYVPSGYNSAPIPFIRIDPPAPEQHQAVTLFSSNSFDKDHFQSSLVAVWDVDNDGQFDTEPADIYQTVQHLYENPGNYLIRLKLTDPAGAETISTPVSIKIPGEKKIAVERFTLINADNDQAVGNLQNNMVINFEVWDGKTFSVRANTSSDATDRVEFELKGPITHKQTDSVAPFALFGDNPPGDFIGRKLFPGEYTLTATPFSSSGTGLALTVSFSVKVKERIPGQATVLIDKTIGGAGIDYPRSATATLDGGYLLAGYSNSNVSGDKSENDRGSGDYWVVKIDAHYNKLWDRTFGGENLDEARSIISTPDGSYLLTGSSESGQSGDKSESGNGVSDYWVLRLDNQGNKIWDKGFGGYATDVPFTTILTSDGGFLLGGSSESHNSISDMDYWVVKIDNQGNKEWDKTIGGGGADELHTIMPADGGWLLFGNSQSNASGNKSENSKGSIDYWVVKIDNDGNTLWDKTIGGSGYDDLATAIVTHDGSYLLTGYSRSNASGDKSEDDKGNGDYWVVKIDGHGNILWDKTIGGSEEDVGTCSISIPEGGYLIAGYSNSNATGDKSEKSKGEIDYWVIKIDNQGNKVWDKTIGGSLVDVPISVIRKSQGRYLVAGYSGSNASGDKSENSKSEGTADFWVVELEEPINPVTTSLTLMNAHTDQEIQELKDGDVINLAAVGTKLLDIRANITAENINKVAFDLKGPVAHRQTEMNPPYALFSNRDGDFKGRELLPGAYTLTVTPYITDIYDAALTISFTVTEDPVVTSLTLMNAHTDQEIKELNDGDVISLAAVGTNLLDIRANITAENVSKVAFDLKGPVSHRQTELNPPYALFSNREGNFKGGKFLPGAYTLTVTPYIIDTKSPSLTIAFTVIEGSVVTSLTLMNAHTDQEIKALNDGDIISLAAVGTNLLDIRANTTAENVSKVAFDLKGPVSHRQTELNPPYALFSNHESDFKGRDLLPGAYSLIVTPYINNKKGTALTISFAVTSDNVPAAGPQVQVYPVPASAVINIVHEGQTAQAHMTLLDFQGNVLLHRPLSSQFVEQLDVSTFRKGIHYLKVVSPEGLQIIRLVIE